MSKKEFNHLTQQISRGLYMAHEKMLREKAMHGQSLVYADKNGNPIFVKASKALDSFMGRKID